MKQAIISLLAVIAAFTGYLAVSHYLEAEQAKESAAAWAVERVYECSQNLYAQGATYEQVKTRCNP